MSFKLPPVNPALNAYKPQAMPGPRQAQATQAMHVTEPIRFAGQGNQTQGVQPQQKMPGNLQTPQLANHLGNKLNCCG